MSNKKFMVKCIMALMLCIIGLTSCGNDNKIPANEIHYTTIDNSVLPIKNLFYFGEGRIVSNSYVPDKNVCILKLDKDVTEIGEEPFNDCESLTTITIPPSVTEIEEGAFKGCRNLTFITLPESLTKIEKEVFSDCYRLRSISIPESVTKIGEKAFSGCSSLTSITIHPSVWGIGWDAFSGCSSLTSITVSKENKFYDSREDCNAIIDTECNTLERGCMNTVIPPSVTKIGSCAFSDCSSLTSISIPSSVTEIEYSAFSGCSSLTSISIPESVTEIEGWAFSGCSSLTEVRIPKGCNVHEYAFSNSRNVEIIRY